MFGWLEFEDDPDVVPAMLEAAAGWLRQHGRDHMIGPMDFTMNDESGVMIEGFERQPMIKQPWHPPYYQRRCEEAGLDKAEDLIMYELVISDRSRILPIVFKLAERVEPRHGITIRRSSRRALRPIYLAHRAPALPSSRKERNNPGHFPVVRTVSGRVHMTCSELDRLLHERAAIQQRSSSSRAVHQRGTPRAEPRV
jgi:hypothetical protein